MVIADAQGLIGLLDLVPKSDQKPLFDNVTRCFESGRLRFPQEVIEELHIIARNDFISGWGTGLGATRDAYTADIAYLRPLMALVACLGFSEGFEALDNKDPAIIHVGRLAFELQDRKVPFCILSTDSGTNPLVPTMEQLCDEAGWAMEGPAKCAELLSLLEF
ncbi:hypothetical protein [Cryobacterium sp. TMT2-4]|uniref:hypothetical protein n=1 Tax=Cryobacterium sp. TMT2-4 TaxID=1259254 RepID=UPI00106D1850|nr:hypothetical protein [Cryobacterium sp. TMT2-4]TFC71613.1 hypothetical protein E3O54_00315 [Cryobacterium sp. TMT2-4]